MNVLNIFDLNIEGDQDLLAKLNLAQYDSHGERLVDAHLYARDEEAAKHLVREILSRAGSIRLEVNVYIKE